MMQTFFLLASLAVVDCRIYLFQPCQDLSNIQGGFSDSFMNGWWYTMYQDRGNWNTMCPIQRLKFDDTSGIYELMYSYRPFFGLFRSEGWALVRCNTVDGKCYVNWWGWLNGYTSGVSNYVVIYTSSTYNTAVLYECEPLWWLLWTSVEEHYEIWASEYDVSTAGIDDAKNQVSTVARHQRGQDFIADRVLHDNTQGVQCYG